ncbi:MAG: PAS domain-containing sensor histidine kinase [Candidatus Thermoplasmatota archaeon]
MNEKSKEERKEELGIYKNRLEDAMEAGNLAWWEMDMPSGKVRFNDRKAEMLGYSPEKFEHYSDFTDLLHPEDHERAMQAMREHLEGRKERYEVEYRIEKKNGDYKWFRDVGSITEEDEDSEYKKVTGVVIDIDERKRIENREDFLHSLLRHDVGNKIQIVQGYLQLAEDFELPEELEDFLSKGKKAIERSQEIIEKIEMVRKVAVEEEIETVEVCSILESVISDYQDRLEKYGFEFECEKETMKVVGGPLLEEMFSNVLENTIKHSECENIKISSESQVKEVLVKVEDDGKGISEDIKGDLFERGFKKGESGGSGLGLYLVKEIVESYGGNIEVKDSEMGGAMFEVHLQKAEK